MSSPHVIPPSPGPSDQLVCHRVKECCVQLHGCVQRWKQVTDKGFDIANKLVNTLLHQKWAHGLHVCAMCDVFPFTRRYTQGHPGDGLLRQLDVLSTLEAKVIKERETLYSDLKQVQNDLVKVVDKMGTLTANVKAATELMVVQGHNLDQPIFQTLPPAKFGSYCEEVYMAYSQEISLRENIISDILKQSDRDTLTIYLSSWLHEPYIGYECREKLEALLMEAGLR